MTPFAKIDFAREAEPWLVEHLPARYHKGRMVEPPGVCVWVTLSAALRSSVVVCPETTWDRVVKAVGISREFQTDNPEVDARFMLSGYVGDDLTGFFRSAATHQSFRELFDLDFDRIEFFDAEIRAICRPWLYDAGEADPPEKIQPIGTALVRLRAGLPLAPGGSPTAASRLHHVVASIRPGLWVTSGVLGAAGLLLLLAMTTFLSTGELLARLGGPSLAAGLAAVVALGVLARRFAFRGVTLAAVMAAMFLVVSSGTLTTLAVLNETLDTSPAIEHSQFIQNKWTSSGRRTSYYITTLSWRPDHAREQFSLNRVDWSRIRVGESRYLVHSRAGYFGVEWLQDSKGDRVDRGMVASSVRTETSSESRPQPG